MKNFFDFNPLSFAGEDELGSGSSTDVDNGDVETAIPEEGEEPKEPQVLKMNDFFKDKERSGIMIETSSGKKVSLENVVRDYEKRQAAGDTLLERAHHLRSLGLGTPSGKAEDVVERLANVLDRRFGTGPSAEKAEAKDELTKLFEDQDSPFDELVPKAVHILDTRRAQDKREILNAFESLKRESVRTNTEQQFMNEAVEELTVQENALREAHPYFSDEFINRFIYPRKQALEEFAIAEADRFAEANAKELKGEGYTITDVRKAFLAQSPSLKVLADEMWELIKQSNVNYRESRSGTGPRPGTAGQTTKQIFKAPTGKPVSSGVIDELAKEAERRMREARY